MVFGADANAAALSSSPQFSSATTAQVHTILNNLNFVVIYNICYFLLTYAMIYITELV